MVIVDFVLAISIWSTFIQKKNQLWRELKKSLSTITKICVIIITKDWTFFFFRKTVYDSFQVDALHLFLSLCLYLHLTEAPSVSDVTQHHSSLSSSLSSLFFCLSLYDFWLQTVSTQQMPQPRCFPFCITFSNFSFLSYSCSYFIVSHSIRPFHVYHSSPQPHSKLVL